MDPMSYMSKDIKAPYRVRVFDRESYNGLHFGINLEKNKAVTICAFPDGVIRLVDCKNCVSEPLTFFDAVRYLIEAIEADASERALEKSAEEGGEQ